MPVELLAEFMTEFWEFQRKHLYGKPDWDVILREANALAEKYDNDYCKGHILWCVDFIEHIKDGRQSVGTLEALYERLRKQRDERRT